MTTLNPALQLSKTYRSSVRTKTDDFKNPDEYLKAITIGLNMETDIKLMSIDRAFSNAQMSCLVLNLENKVLQEIYGKENKPAVTLIRCYRKGEKFFEMPLCIFISFIKFIVKKPLFIDVFITTIGFILDGETDMFYAIDVGLDQDRGELKKVKGQPKLQEFEHEFEETIIGFKLGHFRDPYLRNLKAVFWSETQAKIYPFNIEPKKSEEKVLMNNIVDIEFELDNAFDIERILDFGVQQELVDTYDQDIPEIFLVLDTDGNLRSLKSENFGKVFIPYQSYCLEEDDDFVDYREERGVQHVGLAQIHDCVAVSKTKVIALVSKKSDNESKDNYHILVLEATSEHYKIYIPGRQFQLDHDTFLEAKNKIRKHVIADHKNDVFYLVDYYKSFLEKKDAMDENIGQMALLPISNNVTSKADSLMATPQIIMNIIANNLDKDAPTKGLLFDDFLCSDNVLVLLHGRVISCFDLQNKKKENIHHLLLPDAVKIRDSITYDFSFEPVAVWMMDKNVKDISQRWRVIVAFRNGTVQELQLIPNDINLKSYLRHPKSRTQEDKLPGNIKTIIRNRNSRNQPIYFIIDKGDEQESDLAFASIEFSSRTYREFDIPSNIEIENSKFVVLDIKDSDIWYQEIGIFQVTALGGDQKEEGEEESNVEQVFIHAKIRIGQTKLKKKTDFTLLNREDLSQNIPDVRNALDTFVDGNFIYFVFKKEVVKYNIENNSYEKTSTGESMKNILAFGGRSYYWRTMLGGTNDNRYVSRIYFENMLNFENFRINSNDQNLKIFEGIYPHVQNLQYDSMSESIACFTDFYQFQVFPLLHLNRIKVKIPGQRNPDENLIATKVNSNGLLVTLNDDNKLRGWNLYTGKYLIKEKQIDESIDLSNYIFHQRINDDLTLIREKKPLHEVLKTKDALFSLNPSYNYTDEENEVEMYRYKIIRIESDKSHSIRASAVGLGKQISDNLEDYNVIVEHSFLGPHSTKEVNFGLYSSDNTETLAFFYKDSQDRAQIVYFKINDEKVAIDQEFLKDDKEKGEIFYITQLQKQTDPNLARLSRHSPNFLKIVVDGGQKDYRVLDSLENTVSHELLKNLNQNTIETPNFLTNDTILFLTEDKIMMGYNYLTNTQEFLVSHCNFPGSTEEICLATILKVGEFVIGENCLTYSASQKPGAQKEETILPNVINHFYEEIRRTLREDADEEEIQIIQAHYKTKVEFNKSGYFGYQFSSNELQSGKSSQVLYILSTFSYHSWRTLELLKNKNLAIEDIDTETLKELAYVQLPNGDTILHSLYKNKVALEYYFRSVQPDPNEIDPQPFYVPLLKDKVGRTALDLALNHYPQGKDEEEIENEEGVLVGFNDDDAKGEDLIHRKAADLLLKHIGTYPFGLFKIKLRAQLKIIIEQGIPEFANFMEAVAKTPSFLSSIDRAKVEVDETCGAKVLTVNDVWAADLQQFKEVLDDPKVKDEQLIQLKVIDLPELHHQGNNEDDQFYEALANTDDDSIFQIVTIKALIEQKWEVTRWAIIKFLLLPYLVYLILFTIYTMNDFMVLNTNKDAENYNSQIKWQMTNKVFLYIFLLYFVGIEVKQCMNDSLSEHLSDFWNYLDIMPPIFIVTSDIFQLVYAEDQQPNDLIRIMFAFTALAMWLRFLYFFRIYKQTGYFIKMIVEVVKDMSQFFFILLITIVAFAHVFYIYFKNFDFSPAEGETEPQENPLATMSQAILIVYYLSIGEFAVTESFQDDKQIWIGQFFFILATLFVLIVLLNLLISIVGETFGRVRENQSNFMYKDLIELIVENQFLLTASKIEQMNGGKYVMLAIQEDNEQKPDEIIERNFDEMKSQFQSLQQRLTRQQNETAFALDRILKAQKKIQQEITSIKEKK